jgi:hypothetical protein
MIFWIVIYFAVGLFWATVFALMEYRSKNKQIDVGISPKIFSYMKLVLDWPVFLFEIFFYKAVLGKMPYDNVEIRRKDESDKM